MSVVPASVDQPLFQWCQSNPFCGIQLGLVVYFYPSVMAINSTVNKYCEAQPCRPNLEDTVNPYSNLCHTLLLDLQKQLSNIRILNSEEEEKRNGALS